MSLQIIEKEIAWYRVHDSLADIIRKLGNMGFEFSGHGVDLGSEVEDFSLVKDYSKNASIHVSLSRLGRKNLLPYITLQLADSSKYVANLDVKRVPVKNLIATIKQIEKPLQTMISFLKMKR